MTEQMLQQLEDEGNRSSELIKRFAGNEMICIRLIKKFPSDENFQKYLEQIRVQDYKNAEQSVHTLKGVASNLGLTLISDLTQLIVDEIRGERDYKKIEEWTHELEPIYQKTVDIIKEYM